jgi:ABC-type Mn2+/Zn2+ transport system ATPase subunit
VSLVRADELAGGYVPGRDAISGVAFALEAGEAAAVLGPNGGGKTTLFRALLGELPVRRGTVELAGRPAYVPQTDRARLDFPVSALDVAEMGAYGRTPFYRRLARADRAAAAAALERVGLAGEARESFGTLSGVDAVSAARIEALFAELRAEGRALLIATHDVHQARRFDRVLCLHGRQVAFGAPDAALTPAVLQETYGDELVVLEGGGAVVTVDHHAH